MDENKKNESIQSRREFFKNAAKGALPILGAVILANVPTVLNAAETNSTSCGGCNYRCMNFCTNTCYESCKKQCADNCRSNCRGTCARGIRY